MATRSSDGYTCRRIKWYNSIASVTRRWHPRGTGRLLLALTRYESRQGHHLELVREYHPGLLINLDLSSMLEWRLFFFGQYEQETAALLQTVVRPGAVAIDVGANIGVHTLIMARSATESGAILAAEPQPRLFERLVANVQLNRMSNIRPMSCALSDVSGTLTLYSPKPGSFNDLVASLYRENVAEAGEEFQVEVRTLDQIVDGEGLDRLDLVKTDTEGHEYKVLLGGQKSIARFRPHVLLEYDRRTWSNARMEFAPVKALFTELGYTMHTVRSGYLTRVDDGLPESGNILAVPR